MRKLKPPAPESADCGHFYTEDMKVWLGGYRPVIAREHAQRTAGKPKTAQAAQRLKDGRAAGADAVRDKIVA